jgi:hypothetical protein
MSPHQDGEKYYNVKIANRSFEYIEKLKYLGTTFINQNLILEEITRRFYLGNACYISVKNLLFSRLLSKNVENYNFVRGFVWV